MENSTSRVLVTGATGYIASHIITKLLGKGYAVRGTVRSLENTPKYQYLTDLKEQHPEYTKQLELVEGDLLKETEWPDIVEGCRYVLHVASPMIHVADDPEEIIRPAIDGTLNVLKAAAAKGVKKTVVTSSCLSLYANRTEERFYDENDWNDLEKFLAPYPKSKTLAEKAAWDFAKDHPEMELSTVLPSFVAGPTLVSSAFSSSQIIGGFLTGKTPVVPHVKLGIVDVRDIATAHIGIMEADGTNGERYAVFGQNIWMNEMVDILRGQYAEKGFQNITTTLGTREVLQKSDHPFAKLWIGIADYDRNLKRDKLDSKLNLRFFTLEETFSDMIPTLFEKGLLQKP